MSFGNPEHSPASESPTTLPELDLPPKTPASIEAMDQLGLSNSPELGDEYYREQWSGYYTDRRRLLRRIFCLAGGLVVLFPINWWAIERQSTLRSVLSVSILILMFALALQWAVFNWRMRAWDCPQCGEYFFASTLFGNPFGRHCRHCGLVRPEESEIHHLHYEDEKSRSHLLSE